jgi:hypothetical protein
MTSAAPPAVVFPGGGETSPGVPRPPVADLPGRRR